MNHYRGSVDVRIVRVRRFDQQQSDARLYGYTGNPASDRAMAKSSM